MRHQGTHTNEQLTIRWAIPRDREALRRLAERDSSEEPRGATLLAEIDGRPLAAISLDDGVSVADPFAPSAEAMSLLRARRRQLVRRDRRHSRGSLAGSPPGAGGRLLVLPPR